MFEGAVGQTIPVQVLLALQTLKASTLCEMCGPLLDGEITGIIGMIDNLSQGFGVTAAEAASFSQFFKSVLKKLENFCVVSLDVETSKPRASSGSKGKTRRLVGRKALEYNMQQLEKDLAKGIRKELCEFECFRAFSWLLTDEEQQKTTDWIRDAMRIHVSGGLRQIADKVTAGDGGHHGGGVLTVLDRPGEPRAASSASSSIMKLSHATLATLKSSKKGCGAGDSSRFHG